MSCGRWRGARSGPSFSGHDSKLTSLALAAAQDKLFSVDDTGHLMCWDLKPRRVMAPAWVDNDNCQLCDVPFFWNVKVMWDRKVGAGVGSDPAAGGGRPEAPLPHLRRVRVRQLLQPVDRVPGHGLREAGAHLPHLQAQDGGPPRAVRVSAGAWADPVSFSLTPLASSCELKQGVVDMRLQISQKKLATVGFDRAILVWNVEELL